MSISLSSTGSTAIYVPLAIGWAVAAKMHSGQLSEVTWQACYGLQCREPSCDAGSILPLSLTHSCLLPCLPAGDNDQPHPCIGNARRMMVPQRHQQASVMIEAVMNHTPEVGRGEGAGCEVVLVD